MKRLTYALELPTGELQGRFSNGVVLDNQVALKAGVNIGNARPLLLLVASLGLARSLPSPGVGEERSE
jgi:hypothetical protein